MALELKTEVLSADSRQFYKELNIGTAKPSLEEMKGIAHHFIDSHSITSHISSAVFASEAEGILKEIFKTQDYAILVGGSGMYIDALCQGIDDIPVDANIKNKLQQELEANGLEFLLEELKQKDPVFYEEIDKQNPMRLLRALEAIRITGKQYSQLRTNKKQDKTFNIKRFVIDHPREILYQRIDQRVLKMMDDGLLDEVKSVRKFSHLQALQTVGYKELFTHLDQQISLQKAVELIQKNTRNYAKRQLTWFRRHEDAVWMPHDADSLLVKQILSFL